jgi:hypothetical protein
MGTASLALFIIQRGKKWWRTTVPRIGQSPLFKFEQNKGSGTLVYHDFEADYSRSLTDADGQ